MHQTPTGTFLQKVFEGRGWAQDFVCLGTRPTQRGGSGPDYTPIAPAEAQEGEGSPWVLGGGETLSFIVL